MLHPRLASPLIAVFLGAWALGCAPDAAEPAGDVVQDVATGGAASFNVMAPLVIGDARAPRDAASEPEWGRFRGHLQRAKALGAKAVSTDVWWGLVEGDGDQAFRWDYYDRMSDEILGAGLDWVPILSFHQCGGNVGDECNVPIPGWIGEKYRARGAVAAADDVLYRSARGNTSHEVLSAWATPIVIGEYREFMEAFQAHFAGKAGRIAEVNVSLGAAGELRYPSYNGHDPGGGYPTRGTLQSYGRLAVESFRRSVIDQYGSAAKAGAAWGAALSRPEDIGPPSDAEGFFARNDAATAYGKDFTRWYQASLLAHGRQLLATAVDVFDRDGAPLRGVDIGGKVPGVHWRMDSDRHAEITAGLVRSEDLPRGLDESTGAGYGPIVDVFASSGRLPRAPRIVLHFTCLEMDDGDGGPNVASRAKSLVYLVGKHASSRGVAIKGENALAGTLGSAHAWENMGKALEFGGYRGLTLLRVGNVVDDPTASAGFSDLVHRFAR